MLREILDKSWATIIPVLTFCLVAATLIPVLGFPGHVLILLAGDSDYGDGFGGFSFFFWPLAIVGAILTLVFDNIWRQVHNSQHRLADNKWRFWRPGLFTEFWLLLYFSPILCNGLARLLRQVDCATGASFFFKYRWESRWALVVFAIITVLLYAWTSHFREWWNEKPHSSPPTESPPGFHGDNVI